MPLVTSWEMCSYYHKSSWGINWSLRRKASEFSHWVYCRIFKSIVGMISILGRITPWEFRSCEEEINSGAILSYLLFFLIILMYWLKSCQIFLWFTIVKMTINVQYLQVQYTSNQFSSDLVNLSSHISFFLFDFLARGGRFGELLPMCLGSHSIQPMICNPYYF